MAKETIDNQNVKSKRDSFRERLAQRYPDLNMDDDEAVYNQIATDYDQYDQSKKRMDDFNNMLKENPHAPGLVTGLITKKKCRWWRLQPYRLLDRRARTGLHRSHQW